MHLKISSTKWRPFCPGEDELLTHWGRVTHICVSKLPSIGSDNGLSPGRRQAIIWPIAGILLIGPLWTNFSEILIEIPTFSFKKMLLKVSSAKWQPFCPGEDELLIWWWKDKNIYGSGYETVAVLLPGFAINWQPQFRDLTHLKCFWYSSPF